MSEQADARRMRILEQLREAPAPTDLEDLARVHGVDARTVRRDVDLLQDVLQAVRGIEIQRGRVVPLCDGLGDGYFDTQLGQERAAKEAIARAVVEELQDNTAIALTAGSSTYYVARQIRRCIVENERPKELIVFTNSLPALLEIVAAGVSTGVLGEVYNADDRAFHCHEYRTAFQASLAVVGASGVVFSATAGALDLFSHRAEEAAFLRQLLATIPEIVVAVHAGKIGRRHPWSFTSGSVLAGKSVRLVTSRMDETQRDTLERFTVSARRAGISFTFKETA